MVLFRSASLAFKVSRKRIALLFFFDTVGRYGFQKKLQEAEGRQLFLVCYFTAPSSVEIVSLHESRQNGDQITHSTVYNS